MDSAPRIRILPPETAKRIAAGEVIERPASVLRELLDNALDAGASTVEAELEGGGILSLRVTDDGRGMGPEDLALSVLPHATSKIAELDDLLTARTLGFRGEALASVAAVARLEILSAERDGVPHRLTSLPGSPADLEPAAGKPGTTVRVRGLFDSYPARKRFLKRPATESALCRQALVDKALPFPAAAFRLFTEGALSLFLPPAGPVERVAAVYASDAPAGLISEVAFSGPGFEGRTVIGDPALARTDRRHSQVFVNRRRVAEYSLLQALDWAFSPVLPGGLHPFAFLFLEIDPSLVDFNIHPAKREVRFRDIEPVRKAVVRSVQDALSDRIRLAGIRDRESAPERSLWEVRETPGRREFPDRGSGGAGSGARIGGAGGSEERAGWDRIADLAAEGRRAREEGRGGDDRIEGTFPSAGPLIDGISDPGFRYLGSALGVFLVYEEDGALWLLDQHAAHERLLFDRLQERPPAVQELLVPLVLEPESDTEETWLAASAERLKEAGYIVERSGSDWLVTGLPAGLESSDTSAVLELLRSRPSPDSLLREAHATTACRAAVKDGDELDRGAAVELIARARELPEPRCPHGRPVRLRFGKDELYRLVKRII
jgi:DNA mismatch repair protein MutL